MDDYSTKLLHYGHVGKAIYHPETQSWAFLRSIVPQQRISYTGVTRTVVRSPSTLIERPSTLKPSTLSRAFPELIGGHCFPRNEILSHTVTAVSETCNPLVSTLLDFGHAMDLDIDTSGRRAVSIVAFASGECGNAISFRTITDDTVDLEQPTSTQLRVPTIGDGDGTDWLSDGVPVRQICFSQAIEDRATFLAVRFSSTVVFRPLYRRAPTSVSTNRGNGAMVSKYQTSRLDPNFLMEISTSHTGGFAHADVEFNPWDQNELAIVDNDGNWSVWEIRSQNRRNKDNWKAACITSGTLPWVGNEEGQNSGTSGRHDGWLAIEWVINKDHVVVCDRRCAMLYRMNGDRVLSYSIELGFKSKSEWVLDVKRSTSHSSHVFILTTYRLIWFDITLNSVSAHEGMRPSVFPWLSWRHFRDSGDITLQLSPLAMDNDFYLVLFSRLNHFVLAFYCSEPEIVGDPASVPDPFILYVPPTSDNADNPAPPSIGAPFSTLAFKKTAPTTTSERYLDRELRFIKAFAVTSNLHVEESLYSKSSIGDFDDERPSGQDFLRARQLRIAGLRKKIPNSRSDFVVDDWDESAPAIVPISGNVTESIAPLAEPRFTFDYTRIYATATGPLNLLSQNGEMTIEAGLQELVNNATDHVSSTSRTALEILRWSLVIDDIDQNAQDLNAFISRFIPKHSAIGEMSHLLVQPNNHCSSRPGPQVTLAAGPKLDLVAIYDQLVNDWLIHLPSDIPGRTRVTTEKVIRQFVADIVLSQILLPQKLTTVEPTTSNVEIPSTDLTYGAVNSLEPTGEQGSSGPLTKSVGQSFRSQAKTPTATTTTTMRESSSQGAFIFPERKADEWPTFKALSSYTTLNRTVPISPDVERILDCWKPGTDPASYFLTLQESQSATGASGRKSRKKVPQTLKSMSLDSVAPPAVSSTVPVAKRGWGSQPDHTQPSAIRLQSSQITDDFSMTQVEPGAFGGREASKKSNIKARKKKRAAGF